MSDYVLAKGAEADLEKIAEYTVNRWGIEQARKYGAMLGTHFEKLAEQDARAKPFFEEWRELQVSRCQHHFVFSLWRAPSPVAILAVFHQSMDLPSRLRERLADDEHLI